MQTPVHKIEVYVAEMNEQYGIEEYQLLIEQAIERHAVVHTIPVETKDCGRWSDSHPLNLNKTDARKYFNALPGAVAQTDRAAVS